MNHSAPHFRLFSESNAEDQPGRWRFVLQPNGNDDSDSDASSMEDLFEAGGTEPDVRGERLELLCVVRGLEALDQPSRVTLITSSAYVKEGIRYGLQQWRANGWRWESFGRMVPVKNQDLWQRVDAAMRFHSLECQVWRFDEAHSGPVTSPNVRIHRKSESTVRKASITKGGAETEIGLRVMPEPPAARSEDRYLGRNVRPGKMIMHLLSGLRSWLYDSAAQVGRAIRV